MVYDGYLNLGGSEFVNLSRTVQLAEVLGIDTLWTTPESVAWIEDALGGSGYDDITEAPWYDPGFPASAEFAGLVPLSLPGLDDSTREATTVEYVTDGGTSHAPRNKTLPIVASMVVVASTQRGAAYGKRWMDRQLRASGTRMFCSGTDLTYFQYPPQEEGETPPQAHRRDVSLTRAASVTRKRPSQCSTLWWVTFTWTANDPYEYGEELPQFTNLGGVGTAVGPGVLSQGSTDLIELSCPVYNYTPIYDPLYPALVPPPSAPDFFPAGWDIEDGMSFTRKWVRLAPVEPSHLNMVPVLTLTTPTEARMIRVSVWPSETDPSDHCGWLWSVILTYLPANQQLIVDGEQNASYAWDGASPLVRRIDSLVYGPEATPVDWLAFNDPDGLLVSMDTFSISGGGGNIRAALTLVPKSD